MSTLKIVSDENGIPTRVELDGVELDRVKSLVVVFGPRSPVTVNMVVTRVVPEYDGPCRLVMEKEEE